MSNSETRPPNNSLVQANESGLSYRQKRRLEQAKRAGLPKLSPSRGLKLRLWREKHPGEKPYAKISDTMKRVVGDKAAEFLTDCNRWVKEYCPLNAWNWSKMDGPSKERLLDKIQGEWNLPRLVDGLSVRRALESQCAALYRGWRYQLKEENYIGYSQDQARRNKPSGIDRDQWKWLVDDYWSSKKQKERSEKNRQNKKKQTIRHSNGAKSTARILEEMMSPASEPQPLQEGVENVEGSNQQSSNRDDEPIYVKLYEKTNRIGKNKEIGPNAEANLNALKALHAKEVKENGVDSLTPFEAFPQVMHECSSYIRGLGYGPKPPKKTRRRADSSEVIDEIQQLQQEKDDLRTEVSNLKSDNAKLKEEMERMRMENLEREKKQREESMERERKMKEELMAKMMTMVQGSKGRSKTLM